MSETTPAPAPTETPEAQVVTAVETKVEAVVGPKGRVIGYAVLGFIVAAAAVVTKDPTLPAYVHSIANDLTSIAGVAAPVFAIANVNK